MDAISGGAEPILVSAAAGQAAAGAAGAAMLRGALDAALEMSAQLMEAMRAASPAGVGGSIDTWA